MKNNKSIRSAAAIFAGLMVLYPAQYVRTASGQTSTQETNPTPFANSASLNNAYFKKGCHVCHSNVGQGARSGKRLVDPLLPAEDFYAFVRRPYGVMPPYSPKVLSDRDLSIFGIFRIP